MSVDILSFGCRLNTVEGEAVGAAAKAAGRTGVAVVNSCAVTAEAVRQARKAVRRLGRERPGTAVVVTGCAATVAPDTFAAMPEVAAVIGNGRKADPTLWRDLDLTLGRPAPVLSGAEDDGPLRPLPAPSGPSLPRGFLPVQTGCDHRCTFCIIPFGRGRSRSLPLADAVAAGRRLLERGAREVVLTGVDLTDYGADLPERPRLGHLVRHLLAALPDLPRLRLSSVDSVEADGDLLHALATEPRLMPHLHLSLQAGDDLVLKRMKRRHCREDALRFCETVRRLRPDMVFGADLIAGFPTETDAMAQRSLDLVAECGLTHLHVFPYSARPGTPAARMPPVPHAIVTARAAALREAGRAALARHLDAQVGRTLSVLAEAPEVGRTEGYASVRLARPTRPGTIADCVIAGHDGERLLAS